ncbi:MAG: 2-isopropylmalate synthase [Treponemataceae bacterium]|nr:2-isopropylmalate synthase [Treponemataceae bacterium]
MAKYQSYVQLHPQSRRWPSNEITKAPIWCSVDLRDGNQALAVPMNVEQKLRFFDLLVKIGFKEIEVGFPSASNTEYEFLRRLIEENHIPDDVTVQVLCQAREKLVKKTMESIKGAKNVIFHIYNSTSPAQRKYTFNKTKEEIIKIAVDGVKCIKDCMKELSDSDRDRIRLEYSPESYSMTECDFAVEICNAVGDEWGWSKDKPIIFNLPTTVECYTPNVYADTIEYFSDHISHRDCCLISSHCHNDRGTGVASCELGILAGTDRVEGTLFGNGERTGNLDIVTVALNMLSQGVDPQLDFSKINDIAASYTEFTGMTIPPRQPYAGELVFTAFSGSHQDAIRKGMNARKGQGKDALWDVPYLLIDPQDIGREYEEIIRINSQSGKGGSAWILEQDFGLFLPKAMHPFLGELSTNMADTLQRELTPEEIHQIFVKNWIEAKDTFKILDFVETHVDGSDTSNNVFCRASISKDGKIYPIGSKGNGPLDAFVAAIKAEKLAPDFTISDFHEHSIGSGSGTDAMAYIELTFEDGKKLWGAGKSSNVARAGINAVVSAINQYLKK